MFRHRWGFEKALDFLCSKRSDAAPNAGIVQQVGVDRFSYRTPDKAKGVMLVPLCYAYDDAVYIFSGC